MTRRHVPTKRIAHSSVVELSEPCPQLQNQWLAFLDLSRHTMKSGFDTNSQKKEVLSTCCALLRDVVSERKHANSHERVTCMIFTMNCKIPVWTHKRMVAKCNMALETLVAATKASSASHEQAESTPVNVCFRFFLRSTMGNLSLTLVSFDRGAHFLPHRHAPRHVQKHVRICSCLRAAQSPPYFNDS